MSEPIIIVGGGPVGAVLALALQQQHVPFTMLEARAKGASHTDTRALALSYGSRIILEKLGIWHAVETQATAISTIHISQRGGFGRTKLNAEDHQLEALGYVLPYGALTQALDSVLDTANIQYESLVTEIKPKKLLLPKQTLRKHLRAHWWWLPMAVAIWAILKGLKKKLKNTATMH